MADPLRTGNEVIEQLRLPSVETLYTWRKSGRGPRAIRVGRHLRWRQSEIDRWLDANTEPNPAA